MKSAGDFLADHVKGIPRSGIRDFFEIVQKRGDVSSLGIGEPDVSAPWAVREAAIYSSELSLVTAAPRASVSLRPLPVVAAEQISVSGRDNT